MATTVLIVDDHPGFRASARMLLEAEGYEVVGEAEDGRAGPRGGGRAAIPTWCSSTSSFPTSTASRWPPGSPPPARVALRDRAGLQLARARTCGSDGGGQRRARLHPQVRAVRRGAGGAHRVIGLRRALWGLGVAGFIAGAVPLVLALSAPTTQRPRAHRRVRAADRVVLHRHRPVRVVAAARTTASARSWPRWASAGASPGSSWTATRASSSSATSLTPLPFAVLFHMLWPFPTGRLETRVAARFASVLGYFVTTVLWWVTLLFYDSGRDNWATNPLQRLRRRPGGRRAARRSVGSLAIAALCVSSWLLRRGGRASRAHPAPGADAGVRGGRGAARSCSSRSWRT